MLTIDIKALSELVDLLFWCYIKANLADQFPATLERLRSNIDDPRWHRKIIYFHALHALWPDWNRSAGMKELRKLGSMEDETDVEILQMYLDVYNDTFSFSKSISFIKNILKYSETPIDKLHYRGALAVEYLLVGDNKKAEDVFDQGIAEFRDTKTIADMSNYELDRLARCLSNLGNIRRNNELLSEAVKYYKLLISREDWTDKGRAEVWRDLGDTYKFLESWQDALDSYSKARDINSEEVYTVFMSESLLYLNELRKAIALISQVATERLSRSESGDYAFTLAAIAIESGEDKLLAKAIEALRGLDYSEPYFRERRDALLLDVIQTQNSGTSKTLIQRARNLLLGLRSGARRYLIMQPNIMGVGLNVEKIIDDLSTGTDQHMTDQPNKESKREP